MNKIIGVTKERCLESIELYSEYLEKYRKEALSKGIPEDQYEVEVLGSPLKILEVYTRILNMLKAFYESHFEEVQSA